VEKNGHEYKYKIKYEFSINWNKNDPKYDVGRKKMLVKLWGESKRTIVVYAFKDNILGA
jgi:hypothetical protein